MIKKIKIKERQYIIWIILLFYFHGCKKFDLEVGVPGCIEKEIKEFTKTPLPSGFGWPTRRYQNPSCEDQFTDLHLHLKL